MKKAKFRFVDEFGDVSKPITMLELVENAKYCAKHPDAPFLDTQKNNYITLGEFCREMSRETMKVEQLEEDRWAEIRL